MARKPDGAGDGGEGPAPPPMMERDEQSRWSWVEQVADRMDKPLTVAGVVFALLVLAETTLDVGPGVQRVFTTLSWLLWFTFVAEFCIRLVVAPSTTRFLRRNWWQLIFLALPFFRFLRPLSRLRITRFTRLGRTLSAWIRSGRTANRRLSGRTSWLAALTAIMVLGSSQVLFVYGSYDSYGDALYEAAIATIVGTPTGQEAAVARVLDVVLAIYSVVVFAALAGILGAYFVENRSDEESGPAGVEDAPAARVGEAPAGQ